MKPCRSRGCAIALGIGDATAITCVLQAMIGALDGITNTLAEMKWSKSMRTSIGQRRDGAIGKPVHQDGIAEQAALQKFVADFVTPRGKIPAVPQVRPSEIPFALLDGRKTTLC